MEKIRLRDLLPDMQTIAEVFPACEAVIRDPGLHYGSIRVYLGESPLQEDVLYLLSEDSPPFPADFYSYISSRPIPGRANHLICQGLRDTQILDTLLNLLARLNDQERRLSQLAYQGADLQELCALGAEMLGNPLYIHDDWFMMIARSSQVDEVMAPEYVASSTRGFIPRVILDDFQNDSDYLETYAYRNAQLWSSGKDFPNSLYVNLWEGDVYRGRMLVIETNHPFRHSDYALAEVIAQCATFLLRQKNPGEYRQYHTMDDTVYDLLHNRQPEPADLTHLLNRLGWNKSDLYLCVRMQNQQDMGNTVAEHILHSDLFQMFPDGYILLTGQQQCVLLNLTKDKGLYAILRHRLAPLCRDYCLYAGISSPVQGVRDLHLAYYQAEIALNQAFLQHNEKWILSFSDCALDHILNTLNSPLQPWHLVSPDLHQLMEYDKAKGTDYFETLKAFLLLERDIPRTSEKLIIHRTTLLYRLKKIQSLISANLDDPTQRLYLTISLWILEKENRHDHQKNAP